MLSKSLFDPIITPTIADRLASFEAIALSFRARVIGTDLRPRIIGTDCRLIRRAIVVKAASIGCDLLISIRQAQSE